MRSTVGSAFIACVQQSTLVAAPRLEHAAELLLGQRLHLRCRPLCRWRRQPQRRRGRCRCVRVLRERLCHAALVELKGARKSRLSRAPHVERPPHRCEVLGVRQHRNLPCSHVLEEQPVRQPPPRGAGQVAIPAVAVVPPVHAERFVSHCIGELCNV